MKKTAIALALLAAPCLMATAQDVDPGVMEALIENAETALSCTGVGYPVQKAQIRATLQSAIADAEEVKNAATVNDLNTLSSAITAYKNSTDIELPADGKCYTITFVYPSGTRTYLHRYSTIYKTRTSDEETNENYPMTDRFVCRDLGNGQYAFVSSQGEYLDFFGEYGLSHNAKGYTDAFDATSSPVVIEKMVWEDGMLGNTSSLFGCVTFASADRDEISPLIAADGTSFLSSSAGIFRGNTSTAIRIEESTGIGNTVTFNPATGIDGVDNIATFSAPFATVAPEGTQVWYVTVADDGNALMQPVEAGLAIPAGAGVILTSSATEATMLPATDETPADLEGNKLVGSGGEALQITDIDGAYILTGRDGQVGFYYLLDDGNTTLAAYKAYLRVDASTQAIRMDFSGTTTDISAVEAPEQANAPIYDLSGRRVLKAEKGVYVKNGKKFIVK